MHRPLLFASALFVVACGGAQSTDCPTIAAAADNTVGVDHANANAVLWVQTSAEYAALTTQSYRAAIAQLDAGLADPTWTASPEQTDAYGELPPAVIMDLDETVLDNSAYQAWLIEAGESFSDDTWTAWCLAEEATAVPGALEFVRYAVDQGVTVFFVSNRGANVEEATRDNLIALGFGFALRDDLDNVLLKREQDDWGSDKGTRRIVVGATHRVVLSIGDNLGDFVDGYKVSVEERAEILAENDAHWGTRWIVLPNPTYGSWEQTLYDFDYGAGAAAQDAAKRDALRGWTP